VYYRGIGEIKEQSVTIHLPDYAKVLATEFTVNLTPIDTPRMLASSRVKFGSFEVYGPPGEFYWTVFGKRDSIVTEPYKTDVTLNGSGPYRWVNNSG
jgi:hypothetical protein